MPAIARQLLARGYATAATAVKAPLQLNSLTGTYATSTYLAALKKSPKDLEALAKDVEAFDRKIKEDAKVAAFIQNPTLSASERSTALSSIVPSGASPILSNLLSVLSENGRLASAPKVFADFHSLMAAYRGELEVVVTSAEPLDSKSLNRLDKALKGTEIAQGKTLKVVNRVNDSVLGGLLVDFGDKTIDLSASSKVNRFNAALTQGV
ncbi:ATP synthase F1, delta subunit [Cryptococcus neoformans]|uniref:ATP synthase subunit 5, mitochondrial n=2 Tax=Cryptococcus neoformans TaxID=5207 RepID=A0A854QHF6_CRYNE|nr:ATP synthase F1, delta subunit [Cryptococcus neoformans var. grubii H99]AUB24674.1 ATP synthase F1, delta subunit [Cryptococcus neoformans var. grubii]OWT39926.1 ATP synthase F1, delta subunit [Cryptococcus neoformans var. grubii Bt1]OWZ32393.1 ATP synthase F1, delta subunit [Cryptococcus neoformans var. grubii AD2-60a]OWZ44240.1 ATP synthase F1, delta subunit [Cryptococcus neoformans var. grubii C23]OWZ44522.1 ATP synthase F1, delta subunit [Cryptococcus neoformans var. grubii AD1-83a]OWZ|eukprot:XP_012049390.1 ATP synthase F1, delta subunit [Cryptococcus neoformans var. grubii H99]